MASKTNAVRLVEQAGFTCKEAFYEYDENDLNGNHAAKAIGFPPEQVFKTLVARGARTGINVFCIPVCCELDLKKAAKAAGERAAFCYRLYPGWLQSCWHEKTLSYIY